ncbi:MAG TPA: hypothetical protein DCQ84_04990 [Candidatus Competibacteraceae bacterium]|nr:hypothetical protein [Candidatus Competibacteraceae bacterium]
MTPYSFQKSTAMTIPVWRALFCLLGALVCTVSWAVEDINALARALLNSARDLPFPQQWANYQVYAYHTLDQEAFQRPYQNAINELPAAIKRGDGPWLAPMKMTSALNRFISTPLGEFIYISGCQPHHCGNNAAVIFDPASGKLALLLEKTVGTARKGPRSWLAGDYTPAMAALLKVVRAAEKQGHGRLPLPLKAQSATAAAAVQMNPTRVKSDARKPLGPLLFQQHIITVHQ